MVLEASAPGRPFAPDALARRLLNRVRGLANRKRAVDSAMKTLRLSLRADSVSLLRESPDRGVVVDAQDSRRADGSSSFDPPTAVLEQLVSGPGVIADSRDTGNLLVGGEGLDDSFIAQWLRIPSPSFVSFLDERGSGSAHWYACVATHGERYCLFVEHNAPGAVDAARRHATELAFEILMLVLDAEHPLVAS